MTSIVEARAAYVAAFPQYPASHGQIVTEQGRPVWYATWQMGNDYRNKTRLYGAYPADYLDRMMEAFSAVPVTTLRTGWDEPNILHAFSGSLEVGEYARLDVVRRFTGDAYQFHRGSVYEAPAIFRYGDVTETFDLVFADPPYSPADAEQYGTEMIDRRRALAALAEVTEPGGHLVWLDTTWPMHRKDTWVTVGRIGVLDDWECDAPGLQVAALISIVRSTQHRFRMATIFERVAA